MNVRPVVRVLHQLRTLGPRHAAEEVPDSELVERYARQGEEAAFAALLRRHGPMVLRVCRGVLRHAQDAEDAFQATWIVFARKAASLRRGEAVAAWLHGVAHRVALKARTQTSLRRVREGQAPERTAPDPLDEISVREAQAVLDEELRRLPARYQAPLLLCCLEGLTRDEAAARLGVSVSTLKSRLEEGRLRLRRQLARRGLSLSALLSSAALSAPASASLPPQLLAAALGGTTAATPSALANAALASLSWMRLRLVAMLMLAVGFLAAGAALLPLPAATDAAPQQPRPPQVAAPPQANADAHGDPLPPGALMRLGSLRHQLGWPSQPLADGRTIVAVRHGRLCWLDADTAAVRRAWPLPPGEGFAGASADGRQVALWKKKALSLWDTVKGEQVCGLAPVVAAPEDVIPPEMPGWVYFSPDGRTLAGIGYGRVGAHVCVWSAATGKLLWQAPVAASNGWNDFRFGMKRLHGSPHLRFLPDGKSLALLHEQTHRFQVRACATGKELAAASLTVKANYSWTVAPDGKRLLAVDPRDGLRAWTFGSGHGWEAVPLADEEKAARLDFTADGKALLLAGNAKLRVRDWPSGKLRREIDLGGRPVQQILPGADGRTAALMCDGETAPRRFDLTTGKETTLARAGHRGIVSEFSLAPDGKVVSAGYDGSVQVWDLSRSRLANAFRPKTGSIFASLSADGKLVASVDWERTEIAIHERDSGRLVRTIATVKPIRYLAFAPKGRLLLTGEEIPARVFRIWDADTGREVRRLPGEIFRQPAFSPDGRMLAAVGEKAVRVLELPSGKELFSIEESGIYALAFSADGRTLACGSGNGFALWEVAALKPRGRIELKALDCSVVRFSADGRWLAWGENEHIQIWDLLRNRPLHTFRGHQGNVTDLRFTPDGRTLISASADSTLLVWDLVKLRQQ